MTGSDGRAGDGRVVLRIGEVHHDAEIGLGQQIGERSVGAVAPGLGEGGQPLRIAIVDAGQF